MRVLLLLFFPYFVAAQCTIANYEIVFCDNEIEIDLTAYEPNAGGTYEYSELGIPIVDPENFEVNGNTELSVVFTETGTNCTSNFSILLTALSTPNINILVEPILSCVVAQAQILIEVDPPGNYEFTWFGPGVINPNEQNPFVELPGVYVLEMKDPMTDCIVSVSVNVTQDLSLPSVSIDFQLNCDSTAFLQVIPADTSAAYIYYWEGPSIISAPDSFTVLIDSLGSYTLYVTDLITGCTIGETLDVQSFDCTINPIKASTALLSVKAYPNPVENLLHLPSAALFSQIYLLNQAGKILLELPRGEKSIDFSQLPSGIYFLLLKKEGQSALEKIIKH